MAKLKAHEWQRLNQSIKMQKSLIKNGRTPHIRDRARYMYKILLEKKREAETEAAKW